MKKRFVILGGCVLAVLASSLVACSGGDSATSSKGSGGDGGDDSSGSPSGAGNPQGNGGATTTGQGGAGNTGPGSGGTGQGGAGQGGSGQGGGNPCANSNPNVDDDGDGFTEAQGDCNDCDPNTNPGAVDVISVDMDGNALPPAQQFDEDCNGVILLPGQEPACDGDAAVVIDSTNAVHGANAMDICKMSTNGSWGIVSAEYVTIDSAPLPDPLGHGLLTGFGPNVTPKHGVKLLGLSSGSARQPTDPGYMDVSGYSKGYTSANPPGFPIESPSCPGVVTGTPYDSAALKLTLKVPTNAKSLSFKFKFNTYEFPTYICSAYNDFFVALMDPPPPDVNQVNKNIAFDAQGNPISVNNALLDVCAPGMYGGKTFTCPGDINELTGTGFETHGATSWLQTNAPVVPGSTITLTLGVYDSGDGVLDSTVLIDDFQWSADPATTGTNDACESGGTGTCDICVTDAIGPEGCCGEAWATCQGNPSCANLAGCVSLCNNDVCVTGCYNNYPSGVALYESTLECLYGDPQVANSVGACGVVCK